MDEIAKLQANFDTVNVYGKVLPIVAMESSMNDKKFSDLSRHTSQSILMKKSTKDSLGFKNSLLRTPTSGKN